VQDINMQALMNKIPHFRVKPLWDRSLFYTHFSKVLRPTATIPPLKGRYAAKLIQEFTDEGCSSSSSGS